MATGKRLTTDEFIARANTIHNSKYGYTNVVYKNFQTKIQITCPIHGDFHQKPEYHLAGNGCSECGKHNNSLRFRKNSATFIAEGNSVHNNKYDYSKVTYVNWTTKIIITCPGHGDFLQTPHSHRGGNGCPKCAAHATRIKKLHTTEMFIEKAKHKHGDNYNYSKTQYLGDNKKLTIICKTHGEFDQVAGYHLGGHGCSKCNRSKGENKVATVLKSLNIEFIEQHKFNECRNKSPLEFDFYIPSRNLCIEYDGVQHFKIVPRSSNQQQNEKDFLKGQTNDQIKNKFCADNNMPLLRIPYFKFNDIESIIKIQLGLG